jgi:hypothetical protein
MIVHWEIEYPCKLDSVPVGGSSFACRAGKNVAFP